LNLPNRLTLARIACIPLILLFMLPIPSDGAFFQAWNSFIVRFGMIIALFLFIVASITDYLDGRIARSQGIVTNMGKLMDPIADKLLVVSVFIALTQIGRIHAAIVVVILAREFLITGLRLLAVERGDVLAADATGKIKTVTQMIAIILLLIQLSLQRLLPAAPVEPILRVSVSVLSCTADVFVGLCLAATVYSGIHYIRAGIRYFRG